MGKKNKGWQEGRRGYKIRKTIIQGRQKRRNEKAE